MSNASNVQIRDSANNLVTVSTLDAVMADGGLVTFGSKSDAASVVTNATPVSAISIWKQISASAQAMVSLLTGTLTVGLPSGAATAANQTVGNANLASIAASTSTTASNAASIAASTSSTATSAASIATSSSTTATQTTSTATSAASIATNTLNTAANAASIATNTLNTAANAASIATNTLNSTANLVAIAASSATTATQSTTTATQSTTTATQTTNLNTVTGAVADAAVAAGATGSLSAKLRAISRDIGTLVTGTVLAAGTNLVGIFKIGDGTSTAVIKAASTAPAATDTSLVVAMSPNAWDTGPGTGGSKTQRVAFDTAQFGVAGPNTALNSTSVTPAQTSDMTNSRVNSAATTNANNLKASAGVIRNIDIFNTNASYTVFLKFYNKATAPTVGTDTPIWTIPLPPSSGYSKHYFVGVPFSTGISYAITKLQGDSDTTAIASGDVTGIINWV